MIVQRVIHHVKQGRMDEFLALMKSKPDSVLNQATKRTYTSHIVPVMSTVVHEMEYEDLAEMEKTWAAWWADPGTPTYMKEYYKLVKSSGSEVWNLED